MKLYTRSVLSYTLIYAASYAAALGVSILLQRSARKGF